MPRKDMRKRTGQTNDANSMVSSHLTDLLIEGVQKLPDCPSVRYLQSQFLSKFVSKDTDPALTRRQRAMNKWLAVERDNEATNDRLVTTHGAFQILPRVTWSRFQEKLRSVIVAILGDTPPIETLIGGFSGGASTSKSRTSSQPARKFTGEADVTSAALPWFLLVMGEMPGWGALVPDLAINEVTGNVFFTVPKNTEIDRVACKEPDLNMFLQKGIGDFIRQRLRKVGIDLNDQTRNQRLAQKGSYDGTLATIDLSSASDSVSRGLVELVMPITWYTLLDDVRSPVTVIDGENHSNEMFSSMGNGFTFELESLLFYAIARTTAYFRGVSGVISVYGDDIICPSELAEDLYWVLEFLGFTVNETKSFYNGSFRESCGGHYDNGVDITPFYLRKPIETLTDLIVILNQVRKWADRWNIDILDPRVEELWFTMASHVPARFWGGREYDSDGQLVSPGVGRSRLVPRTRDLQFEVGGLVHWLCTTWRRDKPSEGVVSSEVAIALRRYRAVPVKRDCVSPVPTPFLREVM